MFPDQETLLQPRNCIQERPTQIYSYYVLYTVGEIKPDRSWRERTKALMWYYSPTKNKLIYQVRTNTYDFWLYGQYGKCNSNILLFPPLGPFPSKMMRCPWILCFYLLPLQYTDLTHEIWQFMVYIFLDYYMLFWSG